MDTPISSSGSGPRACRACAASKAKCMFIPGGAIGEKCRRCNRLNKECIMQTPAIRKRQPKTSTRVDQLEEKLQGLVSLLKPPELSENWADAQSSDRSTIGAQSSYQPFRQPLNTPSSAPSLSKPLTQAQTVSNDDDNIFPDALLYIYRQNMAPQFPFVIVPDSTSSEELARTKPFVYKVLLMVASYHDKTSQSRMTNEIFQYLSTQMILENERSLDLLQGLLILMAWFQCHINTGRRLTLLLQLAGTLTIDLGLSPISALRCEEFKAEASFGTYTEEIPVQKVPTLDESRAILGLHFMHSVTYTFVKEMEDPGTVTEFIETCLHSIERNPEYSSDEILVQLFKLQAVAEEINQTLPRHHQDFSPRSAAPIALCIKTLQSKLDSFRMKLPLNLQQNPFVLMHYHSVLTYLTETALTFPLTTRVATLHACLTSTHAFFSFLFSIPLIDWYKITYITWSQMRHIVGVLYKLSNFESPDWDPSHVRNILDLSIVLENIVLQFEKIQEWQSGIGNSQGDGFLFKLIPKFRAYKQAFESRRAVIIGEDTPPSYGPTPVPVDDLMFGQLDDAFWREIGDGWDFSSFEQSTY